MSDTRYWLAFNLMPEIGPVLTRRLVSAFGSPEKVFDASYADLREIANMGESRARSIASFKDWGAVQRELDRLTHLGISIVTRDDASYPEALRHIYGPPPVLYVKGELKKSDGYSVAMVGSRRSTAYGRQVAGSLGFELASAGLTVVSGLARGIDTAAHHGALRAGGRTVAVLGSGMNVPYPPENADLFHRIASSGAVVSEFPLGTQPLRENFPRRNRIISALSLGVVVVEATLDSGSLITVGYALEQGKDVFAVPGNITSRHSRGTNDLIKNGAKLVDSAGEIIEELPPCTDESPRGKIEKSASPGPVLEGEELMLYRSLSKEPQHVDALVRTAGMPAARTLSILLRLELRGIVQQMEGKYFCLN